MDSSTQQLDRSTLLALVDASRAIISEVELDKVFLKLAEHAASVIDAEGASVLLFDEPRKQLVFQVAIGPGADNIVGDRFDAELGIAGQAVKTRRAMCVDDVRQNRHFFPGIDVKTQTRTRSLLAAPLIHQDQVLGVVEVLNPRDRDKFNRRDVELFEVFANLVSAALANAQHYDRVSRENIGHSAGQRGVEVIGQAPAIEHAMELCRKVALSTATVLLHGETGTGKELAARTIHECSERRDKPFIAINCAALPETLLESELFGHEKGAFTGAAGQKLGRFELADGGTLFLDEIGELSAAIQVKLLRVIQEREIVRVGGTKTITCDVRIIAATNRDLQHEMEAGRFREDLYYRLNVFPIELPPMRDRIEDLPLLVKHFIAQLAPSLGVSPPSVDDQAMMALMQYRWPGNIRELRNVVERCTLLAGADGEIRCEHLPHEIVQQAEMPQSPSDGSDEEPNGNGGSKLAEHERALILKALHETHWNQSAAARNLGISRDHLRYRIKKYGLKRQDSR